jgi:hypothetical protein
MTIRTPRSPKLEVRTTLTQYSARLLPGAMDEAWKYGCGLITMRIQYRMEIRDTTRIALF